MSERPKYEPVEIRELVEVVRCKDCVFFDPSDALSTAFPDLRRCGWLKIAMTEEGYCSYGRRREDE